MLREKFAFHLDNNLKRLVVDKGSKARPTAAFRRVAQRAALLAQESDSVVVVGENVLMAILAETQSPAARLLGEQEVSPGRAAALSITGLGKRT